MLKSFGTVAIIGISLLLAGCPQLDTYHAPHRLDGDIYAGKMNWLSPNIPALNVALMACALQDAEHNKQAMELQQTPPDMFKLLQWRSRKVHVVRIGYKKQKIYGRRLKHVTQIESGKSPVV
jgi:hypothetical protein